MGIKGLNKLLSQYAPSSLTQLPINEFCGSRIAIDSEILIHKFRTLDSKNSHIFGFINNIFWYFEHGIIPIYVFDGTPSNAKKENILSERFTYKEQLSRRIEELENKSDLIAADSCQLVVVQARQSLSVEFDFAAARTVEAADQVQQCRFAGTRWADDGRQLSTCNRQVNPSQRGYVALAFKG